MIVPFSGVIQQPGMNATSPKSSLVKLGLYPRQKTLKVMVLGQAGVGKSGNFIQVIEHIVGTLVS